MGGDADGHDDERTAIVNVHDLRRPSGVATRDRHVLVRMDGSNVGNVILIPPGKGVTIGRNTACDHWVNDDGISRKHARVFVEGPLAFVEDAGSANGTFVRGQRIERERLGDGDLIQLGPNVVFRYSVTDSDEEAMLRQLYEASVRDPLTGAFNREHFDERLKSEVAFSRRHKTNVALAMFDLDHFKKINDTYGHQAGDRVLVDVAAAVERGLRTEDVFARYGGEEFAVVLRGIDLAGAGRVGERLRSFIEGMLIEADGRRIPVTVSVGCAALTCCEEPAPTALVAVADRRLYAAKHAGRNRVVSSD